MPPKGPEWLRLDDMTRCGHHEDMKVNISELKARLSSYLNAVRRGKTVTVLDRKVPIARILPLEEDVHGLRIDPASLPPKSIKNVRGVRPLGPVDIMAILADSRGRH